jgi:hypothetical protein
MPKSFYCLIALGLTSFAFSFGQEKVNPGQNRLTGRVISDKGAPLARVMVEFEGGDIQYTDEDGRYRVKYESRPTASVCCRIRFSQSEFQTLTTAVDIDTQELNVKLITGESKWNPPVCAPSDIKGRWGGKMKIMIPKDVAIREQRCDDACIQEIFFGPPENGEAMNLGFGALWGANWPQKDMLMSSSAIQERYRSNGIGFDYRGVDKKGRRWRFTGWFAETVEYKNASDGAASFFDQIIDSMCWDDAWPKNVTR